MATSGYIKTPTIDDSYFWVQWSQSSQNIDGNTTTISWSCGVYTGHDYYSNAIRMSSVTINGTNVYSGGTYSNFYWHTNHTLASGTLVIPHNTDGSKTFTVSAFDGWLYDTATYNAAAQNFTLTQIPRKATITYAPNFADADNPTIQYSNPLDNSVYELSACITSSGNNPTQEVQYRAISKTGSSYKFELTSTERSALRAIAASNPPSANVTFYVRTKRTSGSSYEYSSKTVTFTVKESNETKPVDTISVSPVSTLPSAFDGLYVQGKTKVRIQHSATYKYGASAASYASSVDNAAYNGSDVTTDILKTSGTLTVKGTAKDSRGFTSDEASKTITVHPYSNPIISNASNYASIICGRCTESGELSTSGTHLKIICARNYSSVNGQNKCQLRMRYKSDVSPSYGGWKVLLSKSQTQNNYNGVVAGIELSVDHVYSIELEVSDDIGGATTISFAIPTDVATLHLGTGGRNVGIGRYANMESAERLDVAWDAHFERGLYVDGDLSIGGSPLADYIVEYGTSGIWTYRKWNSGIAECWGLHSGTCTWTSWGSLFEGTTQTATFPSRLFNSTPTVFLGVGSGNRNLCGIEEVQTTSTICNFCPLRPNNPGSCNVEVNISAKGRWK